MESWEDMTSYLREKINNLVCGDEHLEQALREIGTTLDPDLKKWLSYQDERELERIRLVVASCAAAAMLLRSVGFGADKEARHWVGSVLDACDLSEYARDEDPLFRQFVKEALFYALSEDESGLAPMDMPLYHAVNHALKERFV